jgi:uncharacterized protein with PQ loop repeat
MPILATLMGCSAVVLAIGLSVPQLVRLARTGQIAGVSLAATANSTISFGAWTVYGAAVEDGWLFASSVVGLPGQALTTWLVWRRGSDASQLWAPAVWMGTLAAVTVSDTVLGTTLAPVVIGGSVLWYVTPALWAAWRSADVSGIAAGSWWVLLAEGAIFLTYGLATGEPAMTLYGAVCLTGSTGVLLRLVLRSPIAPIGPIEGASDRELAVVS